MALPQSLRNSKKILNWLQHVPPNGTGAPAGGAAAAAPEGVRSEARRHSPPPPLGGCW
jgi:hypothetical protein